MEQKKVTIHDIADKLKMSASTVSRALSGNTRISQKTIDQVKQTAGEMGYKPNTLAASFRTGRTKTIGVIVPRINRHFFSHTISGIEEVLAPRGYNLMICQTNESVKTEELNIQTLINNRVDGIVMSISKSTIKTGHIQRALKEGIKMVQFDRVNIDLDVDKVINDNVEGGRMATQHLLDQGYRNIIHFTAKLHTNTYADRYSGYKSAMEGAGIDVSPDMIVENVITRNLGYEVVMELHRKGEMPDAIYSAGDYSALGALLALKELGIKVPEEMGVIGTANEPFTELIEPSLTTLEQHGEEMGRSAAKLLLEKLESDEDDKESCTKVFTPDLIIRNSSKRK